MEGVREPIASAKNLALVSSPYKTIGGMTVSKLLVNERPCLIIPSLAVKLGLNEAIVLQQIHYWLLTSQHNYDGRKWVYNSYKEWQSQLPFWSESTIKRTIKSLEKQGYVLSANYNKSKLDQTKWYSLDYEKLAELEEVSLLTEGMDRTPSEVEVDVMEGMDITPPEADVDVMEGMEPAQKQQEETNEEADIPFTQIIGYLNERTHSSYRVTSKKTQGLIIARWKEGFTFKDFKKVIDLKANEWLEDPKWSRYLRPETLFGPKFESYLNQKQVKTIIREEDFNLDDET